MNPSYDNGFGSFGAGGTNPGMAGGSFGQVPVSSGSGDVVLSSSSPKKSKKGLIIAGALILVLIVAVMVVVFAMSRGNGGNESNLSASLKTLFDDYAGYVLFGANDSNAISLDSIDNQEAYFIGLEDKTAYLEQATAKYNQFAEKYYELYENAIEISPAKTYFQDFASINQLSEDQVFANYKEIGYKQTKELIENNYNYSDGDVYLGSYLQSAREYNLSMLDFFKNASDMGCAGDDKAIKDCYNVSETESQNILMKSHDVMQAAAQINYRARAVLDDLYDELYGDKNKENNV